MLKHLKINLTMGRTTRQTQFEAEYVWVNAWTGTRTREKRPRTSTSSPEWLQSPLHLCRSSTFSSSDTSTKYFMGRSDVQTEPHRVRVFLKGFCLRNGTHARIGGRWLVFQSVFQHLGAFLPLQSLFQASQKFAHVLRNDKVLLGHRVLHSLGKHCLPPDVQLPRQHWPWQCLLHRPHPLRCLWSLHCGLCLKGDLFHFSLFFCDFPFMGAISFQILELV